VEELNAEFVKEGLGRLERARADIHQAGQVLAGGARNEGEGIARRALSMFRSAMNYLEDLPPFHEAHEALDEAGLWVRTTFGCSLSQQGTSYSQTCPVALAHVRVGLSPGLEVGFIRCSICWADAESCPHITRESYSDIPCRKSPDGTCNLCRRTDCPHEVGVSLGPARCFHLVEEIVAVREVSFVGRPSQPDARIEIMNMSHQELREALGPDWEPGMPVSCDRCLSPCPGMSDPFDSH
jgi:hypothetical protein